MNEVLETIKLKIPKRFKRGAGIVGPDYYDCCNTGMQPVLTRSPYVQIEKPLFMVGPKLYISDYQYQIALDFLTKHIKRKYGTGKQTVFVYRTRNQAIKKFLEMCQEVVEWNQNEAARVKQLRVNAMQATLDRLDRLEKKKIKT
jgi:hypothetical protein